MLAAYISRLKPILVFLQDPDDLLICKLCLLHTVRLLVLTDSTKFWRKFRGSGQFTWELCVCMEPERRCQRSAKAMRPSVNGFERFFPAAFIGMSRSRRWQISLRALHGQFYARI